MLAFLKQSFRPSGRTDPLLSFIQIPDDGRIVYAVGDVHGCFSQLKAIESAICNAERGSGRKVTVIHLGDMIDRGPDSASVLDYLSKAPPAGIERICLKGNHEVAMLQFIDNPGEGVSWLANGGDATLRSYGVEGAPRPFSRHGCKALAFELSASIPSEHVSFLRGLALGAMGPGYFYVHAGIRPGIELSRQSVTDLLEIRNPRYQDFSAAGGPIIVHGHSPVSEPTSTAHAISVDTACYATGRLSAVRIEGDRHDFLSVTS